MTFLPEVRAGERTRFVYASAAFMCVAAGGLVARTLGDTLFLTRFGSDRLPLMYICTAALVGLIAFAYSSGFGRWSVTTIVAVAALLLVVIALVLRIAVGGGSATSRVLAYLFAEVVVRVPLLLFWTVTALIFNAREAKRLLGPIGAAGTAACIIAGAAIPRVVQQFGTVNLLWVQAGLSAGFGLMAVAAVRLAPPRVVPRAAGKTRARASYYVALLEQPQVRSLAAMVGVATICLVLTDFVFKTAVRAEYAGEQLAAFFGNFYAMANGGALLLQLLAVHHILTRGVGVSLKILPLALFVASTGMAVFAGFGWAVAAKFLEPLLDFTINAAAVQMLYLAVQRQSRSQTRALVDGMVKPFAFALAGALLIGASAVAGPREVALVIAAGTAVWMILARRNAGLYMAGLLESIGMRRFDVAQARVEFTDSALAEHVRQALRASRDEDIPYLVSLLPQWKGIDWTPEYRLLIERPSAEIKTLALEYLADHGGVEDVVHVRRELGHEDAGVRRAAVRAAMKIGGAEGATWLVSILRNDRDASVRAAAAAELINYGDLEDLILGATTFQSMLASVQHSERAAAARALILVEKHTLTSSLLQLLNDPDPDVRLVALEAARSQRAPSLLPAVTSLLADHRVGWKAAQVLPAFGDLALPHLAGLSEQALLDAPPRFALHLAPVLGQIGPRAVPQLVVLMGARNLDLRHDAIAAYCDVLRRHPVRDEITRVERLIGEELDRARAAGAAREAVAGVVGNELLDLALKDEYEQHVDGLMRLLQIVQPNVERVLMTASLIEGGERRAEALEVLDNVLPTRFKRRVIQLFEAAARPTDSAVVLKELLSGQWSEWVTIGAMYCAGRSGQAGLTAAIEPHLQHPSGAIRETAQDALARLRPDDPAAEYDDVTLIKRRMV